MIFKRYSSRTQAGKFLAKFILDKDQSLSNNLKSTPDLFFTFAIPNGGVPVAEGFCSYLNIKYDVLIVRKIKIPWNTEAGFGSVTTDGTVLINNPLLNQLNLSNDELQQSIELTKQEIKERLKYYNKPENLETVYQIFIRGKTIFLVDDGLASGFTMLAAIKMIKKYQPKNVIISVPTAPKHTIKRIEHEVDNIYCPNIRNTAWFAVADAYQHWYDVPESEVVDIIKKSNYYHGNLNSGKAIQ
ncbi:MAG: phosphoribosyltransferase [Candidatus Thorarchaeota archaeon]